MQTYQEVVGYSGVAVAFVCWITVLASRNPVFMGVNLVWLGFMVASCCLIFILIADRVDSD